MSEITIKDSDVFAALIAGQYHPTLVIIGMEIIDHLLSYSRRPTITSAFRLYDSGVHGHGRGLDFRTWDLDDEFVKRLCDEVNKTWIYDYKRPEMACLIFHDTGQGPHLHLQVHPNTRKATDEIPDI